MAGKPRSLRLGHPGPPPTASVAAEPSCAGAGGVTNARRSLPGAEVTTTAAPRTLELGRIGESVPRADGIPKTTGEFEYASDLQAAGMLWGHTVRSPHAHAHIVVVDIAEALAMPGVHAVLTHADVPGETGFVAPQI